MRRGFQEVEGRRINPTSPFAYLPHAVILPVPSLKKTKTACNMQTLTVECAALGASFDSVAFPFLTLPMTREGEVARLINIFTVMSRGRGAGYSNQ